MTNFSLQALGNLLGSKKLFLPSAANICDCEEKNGAELDQSPVCFPWALVELEPNEVTEEQSQFCYCQAANGASVVLSLLENLYKQASVTKNGFLEGIPPVVTFTLRGPEVKVWLSFTEVKEKTKPALHVGWEFNTIPKLILSLLDLLLLIWHWHREWPVSGPAH